MAERYGISESSVKRLIRQHEAFKPSGGYPRRQQVLLLARFTSLVLKLGDLPT